MTYKIKALRPKDPDFDVIVIGTGAGGGVAIDMLQKAGKKVAVVEQGTYGGECPNYGCIPTKALLQTAEIYNTVKQAKKFGIKVGTVSLDYPAIKAWKDKAVRQTGASDSAKYYRSNGIKVIDGHAHFLNSWTISVSGKRYTAHQFLIATGSHDVVPPISGLLETGYINYRQALDLEKLPKSLFIIGGGAIGCEFAHMFSSLGSKIQIAEFENRLLAKEDPDVGELVGELFTSNGVEVHIDTRVVKVEKNGTQKFVSFEKNGKLHKVSVDEILVATGKAPNTDLGLENAGVRYDSQGIHVTSEMQTTSAHIYAAGDVTGKYMLTHVSSYESRIAAQNMTSNLKHEAHYNAVPRCVFMSPEIASVGMTEAEVKAKKIRYQVASVPITDVSRANTSQVDIGFIKIIANKKGVILGGSIVAPRAGEMIHELTLAVQWKMKASKLQYTIHAFPTWSQGVRMAASKITCR